MSYEVIARKYRPQKFDDLIGQKPIAETLKNAITKGKISHAYLFSGPRGVGKTSAARILAKSINCVHGPTTQPCEECQNCITITKGSSLDVIEIDGASNRGIDEIRNLKEKVNYTPIHALYKIYIIDEVHMLTTPAFNALLKTLEEPPPHIIFILATTEPHEIPLTVLSRCQRYDFRRITIKEISDHLDKICKNENVTVDKEALFLLAKTSDGSMRDAQSALDQLMAYSDNEIHVEQVSKMFGYPLNEIYHQFFHLVMEKSIKKGIIFITELYDQGYDLKLFIEGLIDFLRNLFLVKNNIEEEEVLEESTLEIEQLKKIAAEMEIEVLDEMINYLYSLLENFKHTSQFKILVELAFLNLIEISQKISLKFIYDFIKSFGDETLPGGPSQPEPDTQNRIKKREEETSSSFQKASEKEVNSHPHNITSLNPETPHEFWLNLIDKINESSRALASFLNAGQFQGIDNNILTINFNKKLYFDHLNSPQIIETLRNIISEKMNKDYKFKFVLLQEDQNKSRAEIVDPVISKAKTIFKGTIK